MDSRDRGWGVWSKRGLEVDCTRAVKTLGESRTLLCVWTERRGVPSKEMRARGFGRE